MENFEVINPTRIIFGKNQLGRLSELLESQSVKKVLNTADNSSAMQGSGADIDDNFAEMHAKFG